MLRLDPVCGPALELAVVQAEVGRLRAVQAVMGGLPLLVRDDPQRRNGVPDPLGLGPVGLLLPAPGVPLLRLVPDDLAAVERAVEYLADRARGPRTRATGDAR
jgi:hypothetical protein